VRDGQVVSVADEQPSLGQLIWLVRRELEWAYEVDADHPLKFEVGTVELDVTVEATRITTGGGGLDLRVLGVGVSGSLSQEGSRRGTSHVHVTLSPRDTRSQGRRYQVSAADTEPPTRRAESVDEQAGPPVSEAARGHGWAAGDTEFREDPSSEVGD
jgi:hypothetical protein